MFCLIYLIILASYLSVFGQISCILETYIYVFQLLCLKASTNYPIQRRISNLLIKRQRFVEHAEKA